MRNRKIVSFSLLVWTLMTTVNVQAQENEIGVALYGGLGTIKFDGSDVLDGGNGGVSVDYLVRLDENWGIQIGMSYGYYQIKLDQNNVKGSYFTRDNEAEEFEFRYNINRFTETLKGSYFAIPLSLRYETSFKSNTNFYLQGGLKYSFYSKVSSDIEVNQLKTSGYFAYSDAELFGPTFMGFGEFDQLKEDKKMKLKQGVSILGEIGIIQTLANDQPLYFGVYIDYDMTNPLKNPSRIVNYNAEGLQRLNLQSIIEQEQQEKHRLRMFAIGLKVRYAFGL
ncbi:outer membrane beta-barrel protein [Flavobacterium sp. HSC-61S13]|uniref:outer membrane beta-barrel protein n=1 Tax=Flavobacterium sp. HSC-61S13 TaxID=2910963 RepID=UPI00209EDD5D|nr:outer membrane beta-barrel protein [Flavobacterium sp. HSC-61S13]MCP1996391.1 hypothetical protein [Flavobacterium sp. HSC-61S13]